MSKVVQSQFNVKAENLAILTHDTLFVIQSLHWNVNFKHSSIFDSTFLGGMVCGIKGNRTSLTNNYSLKGTLLLKILCQLYQHLPCSQYDHCGNSNEITHLQKIL